ncbi:hypothetical protein Tco_1276086 [Tanacetum coccineum]
MPTEMELTLEQTQQGVSYEVSVDPHGFEGYLKMVVEAERVSETSKKLLSTTSLLVIIGMGITAHNQLDPPIASLHVASRSNHIAADVDIQKRATFSLINRGPPRAKALGRPRLTIAKASS